MGKDDALVLYIIESHYDSLVPIAVEHAVADLNTSISICGPTATSSISRNLIDEYVSSTTSTRSYIFKFSWTKIYIVENNYVHYATSFRTSIAIISILVGKMRRNSKWTNIGK